MASPITAEIIYELTSYSSPTLSPQGSLLAFAQSRVDRDSMQSRSSIMLASLDEGMTRAFTQGPKDSAPQFSPDGKTLAFLRPDDKGRAQIWTISLDGGEAAQVTSAEGGVAEFSWSPNSDALAYGSDVDPTERPMTTTTARTQGSGWCAELPIGRTTLAGGATCTASYSW